jgi:hypothetical protein
MGFSFFEGCLGVNGRADYGKVSGNLWNVRCAVQDYDVAILCGMGKCELHHGQTIRVIIGQWAASWTLRIDH